MNAMTSAAPLSFLFGEIIAEQAASMFVFMAIDAEIFPVGSIGRIVARIAVLVMNRQEVAVLLIEFAGAFGADESVYSEGLFAVAGCRRRAFPPQSACDLGSRLFRCIGMRRCNPKRLSCAHASSYRRAGSAIPASANPFALKRQLSQRPHGRNRSGIFLMGRRGVRSASNVPTGLISCGS